MPNMTLALPPDMHLEMRRHANIKWSEVVRQAIQAELDRLHVLDRFLAHSRLTEKDAVGLGRQARRAAAKRARA
jgi:hypothetical protein